MGATDGDQPTGTGGNRWLQIGELAAEVGLNPKTIRYYEAVAVLPPPQRTDAGYRVYTDADVERLRFVGKAKLIGLSLDEIREIFRLRSDGEPPCGCVLTMLDQKLAAVDAQLRALESFRQELVALREQATQHAHADGSICVIIEAHRPGRSGDPSGVAVRARSDPWTRSL